MSEFIKYPAIEQFRNIVKQVKDTCKYHETRLPILTFAGTVKLHGTNAAVCFDTNTKEFWVQNRKNIITTETDNAGFANYVKDNSYAFDTLINDYVTEHQLSGIVSIFGEWCGGNIQKGVAVCELDKMFVIFGVKCNDTWVNVDSRINIPQNRIFNSQQFKTYNIQIDFSKPQEVTNALIAVTEKVEQECPVGKYFDVSGIGEGVVWQSSYLGKNLRFKVKGEKHSSSKVKKLVEVDTEKLNSINECVDYVITDSRMNQSIEQVFTMENIDPDIKAMSSIIKWVMGDVNKEEADTLTDNNLTMKDITKPSVTKIRNWFINYLNNNL